MSSEKTKWVYWGEGMAQPEDLSGWELYKDGGWLILKGLAWTDLEHDQIYRKAVTEEEYRIFHAQQADPRKAPDGYDIVDFRAPKYGDMTIKGDQAVFCTATTVDTYLCYILEKIEPEINWVTPTDQDAIDLKRPAVRFRHAIYNDWEYDGRLISVDNNNTPYTVRHINGHDLFCKYVEMDASLRTKPDDTTEPEANNEIDIERLKVLRATAEKLITRITNGEKMVCSSSGIYCGNCPAFDGGCYQARHKDIKDFMENFLAENPLPEDK